MWIFTKHGFYSIVCARANGGRGPGLDNHLLMIRGRRRSELEALVAACPELPSHEITENTGTDYRYRLIVPREAWEKVAARLAADVDYGNFKSEAERLTGGDYAHSLHDVWDVMYRHQQREPEDA